MQKLFALARAKDHRRVEFYSDVRAGKNIFVIREVSLTSQDSVTSDPEVVGAFKASLLSEGFLEVSF